jgi:hypothetical protein
VLQPRGQQAQAAPDRGFAGHREVHAALQAKRPGPAGEMRFPIEHVAIVRGAGSGPDHVVDPGEDRRGMLISGAVLDQPLAKLQRDDFVQDAPSTL